MGFQNNLLLSPCCKNFTSRQSPSPKWLVFQKFILSVCFQEHRTHSPIATLFSRKPTVSYLCVFLLIATWLYCVVFRKCLLFCVMLGDGKQESSYIDCNQLSNKPPLTCVCACTHTEGVVFYQFWIKADSELSLLHQWHTLGTLAYAF